jgi:hypothetical protein
MLLGAQLQRRVNQMGQLLIMCLPPPGSLPCPGLRHRCRNSCYLFGRERRVADVPTDHPSCSKQHAVLQYRCAGRAGSSACQPVSTLC